MQHNKSPKYLGIRLHRTLSFRNHSKQVKGTVCAIRINKPTFRTSALALCFSTNKYAASVWTVWKELPQKTISHYGDHLSAHQKIGCCRRRKKEAGTDEKDSVGSSLCKFFFRRRKKEAGTDERQCRLKSLKKFLQKSTHLVGTPETCRENLWREANAAICIAFTEEMAARHILLPPTWRLHNRLETGVSCCYTNVKRWRYQENDTSECDATQDHEHLFIMLKHEKTNNYYKPTTGPNINKKCKSKNSWCVRR